MTPMLVPRKTYTLRPYQTESIEGLRQGLREGHLLQMLCSPTGSGKCLTAGTEVLTYTGMTFPVEQIEPGMALMGPDSKPRFVQSVSTGYGPIVEIVPVKGEPWRCNEDHILTLVRTGECNEGRAGEDRRGEIVDISVRDWLDRSKNWRHVHKLFRIGVEFPEILRSLLPVEPYLLGLLLGDGSLTQFTTTICNPDPEIIAYCESQARQWGLALRQTNGPDRAPNFTFSQGHANVENPLTAALRKLGVFGLDSHQKFIPDTYKTASTQHRRELLAGLLDTDGHYANGHYDYVSASGELANDVAFLARSLGLAAYVSPSKKSIPGTNFTGWYGRVSISGDLYQLPLRVPRKQAAPRQQKKDVLRTGFDVRSVGDDYYYGFALSGDGRFLLGDFTVTHNTLVGAFLIQEALARGTKCAFVCDRLPLVGQTSRVFHELGIPHGIVQGKNTRGREAPVQVCSAQTLEKRGFWPDLGLVVIDEAHTQREKTTKFITSLGKPVIGLSATPFTKGLGKVYSRVVNVVTTDQLLTDIDPQTRRPYLAPLKVYVGREMDMKGAELDNAGEWKASEVEQRGGAIIGDAVTEWHKRVMEHFGKPVKTLVRSRTIAHGEEICRAFQSAGFDFRQVTAYTSETEADQMVQGFALGKFLGLVSVDKFNKGFDVPDILCLSDQRPLRKSLASEIQFLGRGMRASPGKDFVLLLDHTGNYLGFMDDILDFFAEGCNELDEGKRQQPGPPRGRGTARRVVPLRVSAAAGHAGMPVLRAGAQAAVRCGSPAGSA